MKILYITKHNMQENVLKGGELASKENLDVLREVYGKHNVEILKIQEEKSILKKYINYLFFRDGYSVKEEKRLIEEISKSNAEILYFDGSWFGNLISKCKCVHKVILFLHNVEKQYSVERMKKNPLTLFKYLSVSFNEKKIIKKADYIFVLNQRDSNLLKKLYKRQPTCFFPITIKDKYKCTNNTLIEGKYGKYILFVGSYFKPNVEGITWFINNVMPDIKYKLLIVGKGMEKIKHFETTNVKVLGTVEEIEPYYQEAQGVVMPIFSGGGMKVKTAEAFMYGKRIFATHEALLGYDNKKINGILECNTPKEFITAINAIDDKIKFSKEIREYFLENFEYETKKKILNAFNEKYIGS